jgi:photosystem II stability/assembly factor-like uncharacterized protein
LTLPLFKSKIRHVSNAWNKQFAHPITFFIFILVLLLLSLNTIFSSPQAFASTEAARWTRVNIPAGGAVGGWVLANGSDIQHLTVAADGTLYAYGRGLTYTLYKSTDGGLKWSYIGQVQDAITGITVSPHDPDTIYYATSSLVYRSTNGGKTFIQMPASPGGAGSGNIAITSISVAWLNYNIIAVGTRDTDSPGFGGVYTLEEADNFPGWIDTDIGAYDVYAVAFSPNYASDRQIAAVVTDETDTFIISKIGNSNWSAFIGYARLDRDNSGVATSVAAAHSAVIAFPADYNGLTATADRFFFVGIDTGAGEGDVYQVRCIDTPGLSPATDLNIGSIYGENNIDITGLAIYSSARNVILVAGSANSSQTYMSTDGGTSWTRSGKAPTGDADTCVQFAPDFGVTGKMYAVTSGAGSALSISRDIGVSWNQASFINTTITNILDLAPSPDYSRDNALFMISSGGADNLWRSQDGGNTWERIFSSVYAGVDGLSLVMLPPQYGIDSQKVFISGTSNGDPAIWESSDNGQTYLCRVTHNPATGAAFPVDSWAMADKDTLYIGSNNGLQGLIFQTSNGGFFYTAENPLGNDLLYTIAFSPDYESDGNILVGNADGWIYWSDDNGVTYQPLPLDAAAPPLTGNVAVAFDPGFNTNHIIYAAADAAGGGIYRFIVGESTGWESINGTLPAGAIVNRLAVSGDGILYAINAHINGGMERCLNPKSASPTFETVADGLSAGPILSGLWQRDGRLWTIDIANCKLMTYYDTLALPVIQVSPENDISSIGSLIDHTVKNVTIDWDTIDGATSYKWQCSLDTDFSSIPTGLEDTTSSSSVRLPDLEPATTYYWHVRASAPVLGPWSPKWSFITSLDTEIVTLKPEIPAAGAGEVPIKPVFQWTAIVGAEAYELLVAADADFNDPVIVKINDYSLPTNAWQCDVSLDYATTYYWKVRATASGTRSAWSSAGVFTTQTPPAADIVPTPTTPLKLQDSITALTSSKNFFSQPTTPAPSQIFPPSPSTPPPSSAQVPLSGQLADIPVWILCLIGGLLAIVFLALIIVLAVVLKIRRIS